MADEEGSSEKYAVVQFENSEFSVVPTIWLDEPDYCYWPEGMKNIRTLIIRQSPMKSNWSKYKCDILSKHNIYEIALHAEKAAAASSQSETESRVGKRKIKRSKFEDYVTVPEPPKLIVMNNSDNLNTSDSSQENISGMQTVHDDNGNVTITEESIANASVVIENENNTGVMTSINDLRMILSNIETEMKNIKEKQEQSLSQIQETTNLILAKINSEQYKENFVPQDTKIAEHLPLASIDNFLTFEDLLKKGPRSFYASSEQGLVNWREK